MEHTTLLYLNKEEMQVLQGALNLVVAEGIYVDQFFLSLSKKVSEAADEFKPDD